MSLDDWRALSFHCLADGCDRPVAHDRVAYCGAECARRAAIARRTAARRAQGVHGDGRPRSARLVLDDIDPVAVELACKGQRSTLNRGERRAVVAALTDVGLSSRQIARHIGMTEATVLRERKALGLLKHVPHLHDRPQELAA